MDRLPSTDATIHLTLRNALTGEPIQGLHHLPSDLPTIPPAILARVAFHVAALHAWNAAIAQARAMEAVAQQPGRYEYEIRYTSVGEALWSAKHRALCYLAEVEPYAAQCAGGLVALYAACGGKPAVIEEGAHVWEWGRGEGRPC